MAYEPPNALRPDSSDPALLRATVEGLEHNERLDGLAARLRPIASRFGEGAIGEFLRGDTLGHALHPMLTDVPLGCWLAAGVLDVVGGKRSRPAAQRLVALGLLASAPTVASGLAEYATIDDRSVQRVGVAHAAGNLAVGGSYLLSWQSRRKGRHLRGVMFGRVGSGLACVSGYLGGHLSFARGIGVGERHPSPTPDPSLVEAARADAAFAPA
jgi:uncharacterized membrane protein